MRKKATTKRSKITVNKLNKQLMLVSVNIAEKIVTKKQKNDGREPWGFAARLLKEGKETFPSISTGDSETTTGDSNGSTDSESEVGSINSGSNGSAMLCLQ